MATKLPGKIIQRDYRMIDVYERIYLLKNSTIFSEVRTDDLLQIAQILQEESFLKGDVIFHKNENGDQLYLVAQGKIGISVNNSQDDLTTILSEGECFGEMNLLDGQPRSASAYVLEDTELLSLNKDQLHNLINTYPEISIGMLKSLSLKLRNSQKEKD